MLSGKIKKAAQPGITAIMVLAICEIANPLMHLTFLSKTICKMSSKVRLDESISAIVV